MARVMADKLITGDSLSGDTAEVIPFADRLDRHGLVLRRDQTNTLQVNIGLLCNQSCRHCHVEAGPTRSTEVMTRETMAQVVAFAERGHFAVIDITGGAPEMNLELGGFIEKLAPLAEKIMLRSNLTALAAMAVAERQRLLEVCRHHRLTIVSSFPSTNAGQTDAQRGRGVWETSLAMLRQLNRMGYGSRESGLELNLVANPVGAFLPVSQCQAEKKFKQDLARQWGIVFSHLFTFANMPLGRFLGWLQSSGNYESYMRKLVAGFNPDTICSLMCRSLLTVSWEGYLFDCDFNLACGLGLGGRRLHVAELGAPPPAGEIIATGEHCYACTAGAGFT